MEAFEVGGNAFYLALCLTVCAWMAFAVTNDPFDGNTVSGAHGEARLYALDRTEIEVTAHGLQLNALRTCGDWPYRLCYLQLTWGPVWGVVRDQKGHSCKVLGSNAAFMSLLIHVEVEVIVTIEFSAMLVMLNTAARIGQSTTSQLYSSISSISVEVA